MPGDMRREIQRLRGSLDAIRRRTIRLNQQAVAQATAVSEKRFRIGVATTGLVTLGGTYSASIKWSSPMPTSSYNVDASCSAMTNSSWSYTITNQTADGCTITFVAPVLLAAGTVIVVLAVSPRSS